MKTLIKTLALAPLLYLSLSQASHAAEASGNDNPTGVTGEYNGSITTGGSYDPYTGNAKRFIDDLMVTGSVGAYPLKWTRILNSRGGSGAFGDGGGWKHSYQWGLQIWPPWFNCGPETPDVTVHYPDGRTMDLWWEPAQQSYERRDGGEPGDRLEKGIGTNEYNLKLKDGGIVQFRNEPGYSDPVCKYIVDPYGQTTTLLRDDQHRLKTITEPAQRYLEIFYSTYFPGPSAREVIDYVKAYDGLGHLIETVDYSYDTVNVNGIPRFINLAHANYDDNGTHATYTYYPPGANAVHPYVVAPGPVKTCDDVRFAGAMSKIEYAYLSQPISQACSVASGQITEERNATTHAYVSKVDYPTQATCTANRLKRTETRPDGATRLFEYWDGGELKSYTDFANLNNPNNPGEIHHTTMIDYPPHPTAPGSDHYFRRVTDARLNATTTEKEGKIGAVMAVIHPNGSRIWYTYTDPNNPYYVASKTDENDKTTHYDRLTEGPNRNRIWQIRYPDGGLEQFTYNNFGQVLTHLMTSGGLETFFYDTRGLKLFYTPPYTQSDPTPENHPTMYTYYDANNCQGHFDLIDRLKSVRDPRQYTTTFDYNKRGQVTKVTHHDNKFTQSKYNPDGTLAWTADENHPDADMDENENERTRYQYDEYKRVIRETKPFSNPAVNIYYDGDNPTNTAALWHTTSSVYRSISPLEKVTKFVYDSNFRVRHKIEAFGTGEEAKTSYGYDEVGNQTTVIEPRGQPGEQFGGAQSVSVYDERNRRTRFIGTTDTLEHSTSWEYDDVGNKAKETRQDGKVRTWDLYDPMNRVKQMTGFLHEVTLYDYDFAGNLQSMTEASINGAMYEYRYDELNRKVRSIYPVDATNQQSGVHRDEQWWYDAAGNISTYKSPADKYKHFHYDIRNRQDHSYWNSSFDGGVFASQNANRAIGDEIYTFVDYASRPTGIQSFSESTGESVFTIVVYHYDDPNHKISEDQAVLIAEHGTPYRTVVTTYDLDGNRASLSVAGVPGEDYSFTYDYTQRQQLFHINKVGTSGGQFFEYTYDKNGNLEKRKNLLQGGDFTWYFHDMANRISHCSQYQGTTGLPYSVTSYNDYDTVNRLKSIGRRQSWQDPYVGESFTYDDGNQLHTVTYNVTFNNRAAPPGGSGDAAPITKDAGKEAVAAMEADPVREPNAAIAPGTDALASHEVIYNNDAIRRNQMTEVISGVTTVTSYNPNALNQVTTVSGQPAPAYDGNFNLSELDGWAYGYDADNRLISASGPGHSATFIYDGLGRCVKRTVDGTQTAITYDDWKPIIEWDDADGFVAWNLYGPGPDEILVRYQPNTGGGPGATAYMHYHLDGLGNVEFLLSVNNLGLEKYSYDAFGQPKIKNWDGVPQSTSQNGNRFLFNGREYIYTLGLYDFRHRIYHPGLGGFIQTDPIGFKGDPMNLYRYCGGNPIGHSDPTGLFGKDDPIPRDRIWEMARWFDSANTSQGTFGDHMARGATFTYITSINLGKIDFGGRIFNGGVKSSQTVTVEPCDCEITDAKKTTGTTYEYNSSGKRIGTGRASGDSIQQSSHKEGNDCVLSMKGNERNPLKASPGITYNATITLHPSSRTYDWRVKHDAFPSHQLLGPMGKPLHHFEHITSGTTPMRLFPFTPSINKSGTDEGY